MSGAARESPGNNGQLPFHRLELAREVCDIARKSVPIHVIVHYPKTAEGKQELAEHAADVHADLVSQHIKRLNCPSCQKVQLLDAVIRTVNNDCQ